MHTNTTVAHKPDSMSSLLLYDISFLNTHIHKFFSKCKILIINIPKDLLLYLFLSKMISSSLYSVLTLSKTTFPQNLFLSDCITLYICAQVIAAYSWDGQLLRQSQRKNIDKYRIIGIPIRCVNFLQILKKSQY